MLTVTSDSLTTNTKIPPNKFTHVNWGHDIVHDTIDLIREVDPGFTLPDGFFFQGNPFMPPPVPGGLGSGHGHEQNGGTNRK